MNGSVEAANLLRAIRAVGVQRAGDLLDWALTVMPDRVAVQRLHIRSLLADGDVAAAESAAARALLQRPDNVSLSLLRVECLARRGRWEQADAEVRYVLQRRPHHARTRELAAHIANERGEYQRAIALLDETTNMPSDRARALLITALLGLSAKATADGAATQNIVRSQQTLDSMIDPPATLTAAVLAAQGRLLDAVVTLEAELRGHGANEDETLCMLLRLLEQTGDAGRLQRAMDRVRHDHPRARLLLGQILLSQGRFSRAAVIAAYAARSSASKAEALPTLVVAAAMLGRSRLARRALGRLRRTAHGINAREMAEHWQRGMLGRHLRAQHDARQAGSDPGSSVLQALLDDAGGMTKAALKKSRRIKDSAGGIAQLSERKNVLVSSPVDC